MHSKLHKLHINQDLPFPPQERAFRSVLSGESCVVCAPTGAGKTAIAEASAIAMLAGGKRVIYTTPLKVRK